MRPGTKPPGAFAGGGFTVVNTMTSLTGASGEDFASILRSLGYRMERRPKPPPAVEAPVAAETEAAVTPAPAPGGDEPPPSDTAPAAESAASEIESPADVTAAEASEASVTPPEESVVDDAVAAEPAPEAPAAQPAAEAAPEGVAPEAVAPEAVTQMAEGAAYRRRRDRAGNDRGVAAGPGRRTPPPARQAPPCRQIVCEDAGTRRNWMPPLHRLRRRAPRRSRRKRHRANTRRRPSLLRLPGRTSPANRPGRSVIRAIIAGMAGISAPIVRGVNATGRRPTPHGLKGTSGRTGIERREKAPDPNSPFAKLAALKAQLEADAKERR